MLSIEPTGKVLGATLRGVDLKQDLASHDFGTILRALGEYGVLRFPGQWLDAPELKRFSVPLLVVVGDEDDACLDGSVFRAADDRGEGRDQDG